MEQVYGFIKADGQSIVNGRHEKILLRGVGLGGWLLPEGYMWGFPEEGDRPRKIEKFIRDSAGDDFATLFWEIYEERFFGEADIIKIKKEGFNSIRLPFNTRTIITKDGYNQRILSLMDRIIDLCELHELYIILDMHGAPGGQTGTNIDDSKDNIPELFIKPKYKKNMIDLWRFLANRYKDRWIIAGYDLMNEPLPDWFSQYNHLVMPLYKKIIDAIRTVDKNHMIILEGVHWATDWQIFYPKDSDTGLYKFSDTTQKLVLYDDNLMLQFHKYWNNPDKESIQKFIDAREYFNIPIFMGEGGENNSNWYTGAFQMFEDLNISWNFWTYKKMATDNSPCSIYKPAGWQTIIDHLKKGVKMDQQTIQMTFNEYLNNIQFFNCQYNSHVIDSLFRRPPVKVPAIFYDYLGEDISYHMEKHHKNVIDFRVSDGTNLAFVDSARMNVNFQHGGGEQWQEDERTMIILQENEWVNYSINVVESECYNLYLQIKSIEKHSNVAIQIDNNKVIEVEIEEGDWETMCIPNMLELSKGKKIVRICVESGNICLEWLQFKLVGGAY